MKLLFCYLISIVFVIASLVAAPKPMESGNSSKRADSNLMQSKNTAISRRNYEMLPVDNGSAFQERNDNSHHWIVEKSIVELDFPENRNKDVTMNISSFPKDSPYSPDLDQKVSHHQDQDFQDLKSHDSIRVVSSPDFKQREVLRDELLAQYQQRLQSFQSHQLEHEKAVALALSQPRKIIFKKIAEPLKGCFPQKIDPSYERVATTADNVASSHRELDEAALQLGYQDPNEPLNQCDYSEKMIFLAGNTYPQQGVFTLGKEIRDQLQMLHRNYLLQQLESPEGSQLERTLFEEMKRDFDRATFILKIADSNSNKPPFEELLYDRNLQPEIQAKLKNETISKGEILNDAITLNDAVVLLREKGLEKFKSFVGDDRAFQIAIASLMYQRGAADLQLMKYGASRNHIEELNPFFTDGFHSVQELQHTSHLRIGTKPEKQLWYSLEKISIPDDQASSDVINQFQLLIFNSSQEERVDIINKQEFTLHTADILIYTFKKNASFNPVEPLSLDNLPVIITCEGGQLSHLLDPFEGVRPPPPDTIELSQLEDLKIDQKKCVEEYHTALSNYFDKKKIWESRLSSLASRPSLPSQAIISEKQKSEGELKTLRCELETAIDTVSQDPTTAVFLKQNVISIYGPTTTLPSWNDENKKVTLPEEVSFLGGRELQQATTEQMKKALLTCFNSRPNEVNLTSAAKKLTLKESGQTDISLASRTDEQALQEFMKFTENSNIADAVSLLVQNPKVSVSSLLLQEALFGDALSLFETAEIHFSLEKKSHASSESPLFVLTAKYHLVSVSSPDDDTTGFLRTLNAQFVTMLKINPFWDISESNSLNNLPVEVRCTGISIHQQLEPGFFDQPFETDFL